MTIKSAQHTFRYMNLRILGLTTLFVASFGLSAQAAIMPVLLEIDEIGDTVTIASTGLNSYIRDHSSTEGSGVDLLNFFAGQTTQADPVPVDGTLTPSGNNNVAYNFAGSDSFSGSNTDLNLHTDSLQVNVQRFSTYRPAFAGSVTFDITGLGQLPGLGASGSIMVGNSDSLGRNGSGDIIGLWEVVDVSVPEPSQYGILVFLAVAGLMIGRRFSTVRKLALVA